MSFFRRLQLLLLVALCYSCCSVTFFCEKQTTTSASTAVSFYGYGKLLLPKIRRSVLFSFLQPAHAAAVSKTITTSIYDYTHTELSHPAANYTTVALRCNHASKDVTAHIAEKRDWSSEVHRKLNLGDKFSDMNFAIFDWTKESCASGLIPFKTQHVSDIVKVAQQCEPISRTEAKFFMNVTRAAMTSIASKLQVRFERSNMPLTVDLEQHLCDEVRSSIYFSDTNQNVGVILTAFPFPTIGEGGSYSSYKHWKNVPLWAVPCAFDVHDRPLLVMLNLNVPLLEAFISFSTRKTPPGDTETATVKKGEEEEKQFPQGDAFVILRDIFEHHLMHGLGFEFDSSDIDVLHEDALGRDVHYVKLTTTTTASPTSSPASSDTPEKSNTEILTEIILQEKDEGSGSSTTGIERERKKIVLDGILACNDVPGIPLDEERRLDQAKRLNDKGVLAHLEPRVYATPEGRGSRLMSTNEFIVSLRDVSKDNFSVPVSNNSTQSTSAPPTAMNEASKYPSYYPYEFGVLKTNTRISSFYYNSFVENGETEKEEIGEGALSLMEAVMMERWISYPNGYSAVSLRSIEERRRATTTTTTTTTEVDNSTSANGTIVPSSSTMLTPEALLKEQQQEDAAAFSRSTMNVTCSVLKGPCNQPELHKRFCFPSAQLSLPESARAPLRGYGCSRDLKGFQKCNVVDYLYSASTGTVTLPSFQQYFKKNIHAGGASLSEDYCPRPVTDLIQEGLYKRNVGDVCDVGETCSRTTNRTTFLTFVSPPSVVLGGEIQHSDARDLSPFISCAQGGDAEESIDVQRSNGGGPLDWKIENELKGSVNGSKNARCFSTFYRPPNANSAEDDAEKWKFGTFKTSAFHSSTIEETGGLRCFLVRCPYGVRVEFSLYEKGVPSSAPNRKWVRCPTNGSSGEVDLSTTVLTGQYNGTVVCPPAAEMCGEGRLSPELVPPLSEPIRISSSSSSSSSSSGVLSLPSYIMLNYTLFPQESATWDIARKVCDRMVNGSSIAFIPDYETLSQIGDALKSVYEASSSPHLGKDANTLFWLGYSGFSQSWVTTHFYNRSTLLPLQHWYSNATEIEMNKTSFCMAYDSLNRSISAVSCDAELGIMCSVEHRCPSVIVEEGKVFGFVGTKQSSFIPINPTYATVKKGKEMCSIHGGMLFGEDVMVMTQNHSNEDAVAAQEALLDAQFSYLEDAILTSEEKINSAPTFWTAFQVISTDSPNASAVWRNRYVSTKYGKETTGLVWSSSSSLRLCFVAFLNTTLKKKAYKLAPVECNAQYPVLCIRPDGLVVNKCVPGYPFTFSIYSLKVTTSPSDHCKNDPSVCLANIYDLEFAAELKKLSKPLTETAHLPLSSAQPLFHTGGTLQIGSVVYELPEGYNSMYDPKEVVDPSVYDSLKGSNKLRLVFNASSGEFLKQDEGWEAGVICAAIPNHISEFYLNDDVSGLFCQYDNEFCWDGQNDFMYKLVVDKAIRNNAVVDECKKFSAVPIFSAQLKRMPQPSWWNALKAFYEMSRITSLWTGLYVQKSNGEFVVTDSMNSDAEIFSDLYIFDSLMFAWGEGDSEEISLFSSTGRRGPAHGDCLMMFYDPTVKRLRMTSRRCEWNFPFICRKPFLLDPLTDFPHDPAVNSTWVTMKCDEFPPGPQCPSDFFIYPEYAIFRNLKVSQETARDMCKSVDGDLAFFVPMESDPEKFLIGDIFSSLIDFDTEPSVPVSLWFGMAKRAKPKFWNTFHINDENLLLNATKTVDVECYLLDVYDGENAKATLTKCSKSHGFVCARHRRNASIVPPEMIFGNVTIFSKKQPEANALSVSIPSSPLFSVPNALINVSTNGTEIFSNPFPLQFSFGIIRDLDVESCEKLNEHNNGDANQWTVVHFFGEVLQEKAGIRSNFLDVAEPIVTKIHPCLSLSFFPFDIRNESIFEDTFFTFSLSLNLLQPGSSASIDLTPESKKYLGPLANLPLEGITFTDTDRVKSYNISLKKGTGILSFKLLESTKPPSLYETVGNKVFQTLRFTVGARKQLSLYLENGVEANYETISDQTVGRASATYFKVSFPFVPVACLVHVSLSALIVNHSSLTANATTGNQSNTTNNTEFISYVETNDDAVISIYPRIILLTPDESILQRNDDDDALPRVVPTAQADLVRTVRIYAVEPHLYQIKATLNVIPYPAPPPPIMCSSSSDAYGQHHQQESRNRDKCKLSDAKMTMGSFPWRNYSDNISQSFNRSGSLVEYFNETIVLCNFRFSEQFPVLINTSLPDTDHTVYPGQIFNMTVTLNKEEILKRYGEDDQDEEIAILDIDPSTAYYAVSLNNISSQSEITDRIQKLENDTFPRSKLSALTSVMLQKCCQYHFSVQMNPDMNSLINLIPPASGKEYRIIPIKVLLVQKNSAKRWLSVGSYPHVFLPLYKAPRVVSFPSQVVSGGTLAPPVVIDLPYWTATEPFSVSIECLFSYLFSPTEQPVMWAPLSEQSYQYLDPATLQKEIRLMSSRKATDRDVNVSCSFRSKSNALDVDDDSLSPVQILVSPQMPFVWETIPNPIVAPGTVQQAVAKYQCQSDRLHIRAQLNITNPPEDLTGVYVRSIEVKEVPVAPGKIVFGPGDKEIKYTFSVNFTEAAIPTPQLCFQNTINDTEWFVRPPSFCTRIVPRKQLRLFNLDALTFTQPAGAQFNQEITFTLDSALYLENMTAEFNCEENREDPENPVARFNPPKLFWTREPNSTIERNKTELAKSTGISGLRPFRKCTITVLVSGTGPEVLSGNENELFPEPFIFVSMSEVEIRKTDFWENLFVHAQNEKRMLFRLPQSPSQDLEAWFEVSYSNPADVGCMTIQPEKLYFEGKSGSVIAKFVTLRGLRPSLGLVNITGKIKTESPEFELNLKNNIFSFYVVDMFTFRIYTQDENKRWLEASSVVTLYCGGEPTSVALLINVSGKPVYSDDQLTATFIGSAENVQTSPTQLVFSGAAQSKSTATVTVQCTEGSVSFPTVATLNASLDGPPEFYPGPTLKLQLMPLEVFYVTNFPLSMPVGATYVRSFRIQPSRIPPYNEALQLDFSTSCGQAVEIFDVGLGKVQIVWLNDVRQIAVPLIGNTPVKDCTVTLSLSRLSSRLNYEFIAFRENVTVLPLPEVFLTSTNAKEEGDPGVSLSRSVEASEEEMYAGKEFRFFTKNTPWLLPSSLHHEEYLKAKSYGSVADQLGDIPAVCVLVSSNIPKETSALLSTFAKDESLWEVKLINLTKERELLSDANTASSLAPENPTTAQQQTALPSTTSAPATTSFAPSSATPTPTTINGRIIPFPDDDLQLLIRMKIPAEEKLLYREKITFIFTEYCFEPMGYFEERVAPAVEFSNFTFYFQPSETDVVSLRRSWTFGAVVASFVSGLLCGPSMSTQGPKLGLLAQSGVCPLTDWRSTRSLLWYENPFGLSIGSRENMSEFAGAAVMNAVTCMILVMFHSVLVFMTFAYKRDHVTIEHASGQGFHRAAALLRFPSIWAFPVLYFGVIIAGSSARVVIHAEDALIRTVFALYGSGMVGGISYWFYYCITLPGAAFKPTDYYNSSNRKDGDVGGDSLRKKEKKKMAFPQKYLVKPRGKWEISNVSDNSRLSREGTSRQFVSSEATSTFLLRYGLFFEEFMYSRRYFMIADFLFSCMVMVLDGYEPHSKNACIGKYSAMGAVWISYVLCLIGFYPFRKHLNNIFFISITIFEAGTIFVSLGAFTQPNNAWGDIASNGIMLATAYLIGIKCAGDACFVTGRMVYRQLRKKFLKRKFTKAPNEMGLLELLDPTRTQGDRKGDGGGSDTEGTDMMERSGAAIELDETDLRMLSDLKGNLTQGKAQEMFNEI